MRIFNKNKSVVLLLIVLIQFVFLFPSKTYAVTTRVDLLTTDNFAVLGGSAISDVPTSAITGNVGLWPGGGSSITVISCSEIQGTLYDRDGGYSGGGSCRMTDNALLVTAKDDLVTAYDDAAGRTTSSTIATDLAGITLTDGVYHATSGTFSITGGGTLTLDGGGNADSVFIFKMDSTLTTSSYSKVILTNGSQECNVYWQVGSSVTLGTYSTLVGNVLVSASITDDGNSTVDGRLLARDGAVTLNKTTVTKKVCAAPTPTPILTPIFTPTPTPTSDPSSSTNSSTSSLSSVSTPVCTDLAPTNNPNLFQIDRTGSKAVLYFTPVNDYLTYYYIAYGLSQGSEQYGVSFSSSLTSGVVNYTIDDLNPIETYYFKVRGGNGCMPGGWSNDKESNLKNPNLPNTGMGPYKLSVLWPISLGMFLSGCLVYLIRKNYRFI